MYYKKLLAYLICGVLVSCCKVPPKDIYDYFAVIETLETDELTGAPIWLEGELGTLSVEDLPVAAAMEAAFFDIPSVAMSAVYEDDIDIDATAQHCLNTLQKLLPLTPGDVININTPKLSNGTPKGVKVVPHSTKGYDESYTTDKNEQGQTVYYYTGGPHRDKDAITDTTSLIDGYITVTALHFDMTDRQVNRRLEDIDW